MRTPRLALALTLLSGCTVAINNPEIASRNHVTADVQVGPQGAPAIAGAPTNSGSPSAPSTSSGPGAHAGPPADAAPATSMPGQPGMANPSDNAPPKSPANEASGQPAGTPSSDALPSAAPSPSSPTSVSPAPSSAPTDRSPAPTASSSPSPGVTASASPQPPPTPRPRPAPPSVAEVQSFTGLPRFSIVKSFSASAVVQVLDFDHVLVADGTTLYITNDAGRSWQMHAGIGTRQLRALDWFDTQGGYVAGDNGVILRVGVEGRDTAEVEFIDSGISDPIVGLYFLDSMNGYYLTERGQYIHVYETHSAGRSWSLSTILYDAPCYNRNATLAYDGSGSILMVNRMAGALYRIKAGAIERLKIDGKWNLDDDMLLHRANDRWFMFASDQGWYHTDDWSSYTRISADMRLPTEIVRKGLSRILPITPSFILSNVWRIGSSNEFSFSSDTGTIWSAPRSGNVPAYRQMFVFSDQRMWAWDGSQLLRAGI